MGYSSERGGGLLFCDGGKRVYGHEGASVVGWWAQAVGDRGARLPLEDKQLFIRLIEALGSAEARRGGSEVENMVAIWSPRLPMLIG